MNTLIRSKAARRMLVVGLVSACTLNLAAVARAGDTAAGADAGAPRVNIRYGDLNLATSQGAAALYERIANASYAVCSTYGRDINDNADPLALQKCRRKAIADAVTRIGNPGLLAMYNAKNIKPLPPAIRTADSRPDDAR